jgi:protein-tyrosine-phosphatase
MQAVGYDLSKHQSKSLSDLPDVEFDFVATMGCGDECPLVKSKRHEDWTIPDPKDMPMDEFRGVRDLIEGKVLRILSELEITGHRRGRSSSI